MFKCIAIPTTHQHGTTPQALQPLLYRTLKAQHIVSVRGDLDGQLGRLVFGAGRIILGVLVELDAEVEAQFLEAVGGEPGESNG